MRQIVKDMLKCDELYHQFINCLCVDDMKEPNDYSDEEIIAEAKYVANKYTDDNFVQWEEMNDHDDPTVRANARREYNQIIRFLKKYGK